MLNRLWPNPPAPVVKPNPDLPDAQRMALEELARMVMEDFVTVRGVAYAKGRDGAWSLWKYAQRHPKDMGEQDFPMPAARMYTERPNPRASLVGHDAL
jgi:hypothetical protein